MKNLKSREAGCKSVAMVCECLLYWQRPRVEGHLHTQLGDTLMISKRCICDTLAGIWRNGQDVDVV